LRTYVDFWRSGGAPHKRRLALFARYPLPFSFSPRGRRWRAAPDEGARSTCHPGENRGPATREASRVEKVLLTTDMENWIPACAGMTLVYLPRAPHQNQHDGANGAPMLISDPFLWSGCRTAKPLHTFADNPPAAGRRIAPARSSLAILCPFPSPLAGEGAPLGADEGARPTRHPGENRGPATREASRAG